MRLSDQELANLKAGTPRFETAGGGGWLASSYQLSAFRSCAKQLGVDVALVCRAASTGKLGELIQARNGSGRNAAERRNLLGHLARVDILIRRRELMEKQFPKWA
jgi:hypothetical protein